MNPDSFLITVSISLAVGMLLGYFAREFFQAMTRILRDLYAKPKQLERYKPSLSNQQDSSNK